MTKRQQLPPQIKKITVKDRASGKAAVRYQMVVDAGVDPETGFNFDDTRRYIDASTQLTAAQKQQIYEGNARRVYPRLDAALKARGL